MADTPLTLEQVANWISTQVWHRNSYIYQPTASGFDGYRVFKLDRDGYVNQGFINPAYLASFIHAATHKTPIAAADEFAIADSAAGYILKKVYVSDITSYYDTLITTLSNKTINSTNIGSLTGKVTPVDADSWVLVDSAASNVFKAVTGTNKKSYLKAYFDTLYLALAGGTMAGVINMGSNKITNVTDPTSAQDAATKAYVDAVAQGLSVKGSVRLATAAALPANTYLLGVITITATGVLTVDGVTVALNDRLLVKDEASQLKNGIYVCTTAGAVGVAAVLTRSADMDVSAEFPGAFVFVELGTTNTTTGWVCTNSTPPTVGTTAITFTQFSGPVEIATVIHAATLDTTPLDADEVPSLDSASGFSLMRTTWTSIKAFLKTYFDTLYGLLAGNNTWSGTNKFDADTTFSTGTQDYVVSDRSGSLTLQGQSAGSAALLEVYAKDGDGTDSVQGQFWGKGTPSSVTNRERLLFGWDAANSYYFLNTEKAGTGTLREFHLYTGTNTNQIVAATDGNVGIGIAPTTQLSVKAGNSSNDASVGGVLYVTTTQTGNVGLGIDTLATYSVPASTLAVNGQSLWFEASGTFAANANTKFLQVWFGTVGTAADLLITSGGGSTGVGWSLRGRIFRTGAATQKSHVSYVSTAAAVETEVANLTKTLSGAISLTVTGETLTSSNNDIVLETFIVGWNDANT